LRFEGFDTQSNSDVFVFRLGNGQCAVWVAPGRQRGVPLSRPDVRCDQPSRPRKVPTRDFGFVTIRHDFRGGVYQRGRLVQSQQFVRNWIKPSTAWHQFDVACGRALHGPKRLLDRDSIQSRCLKDRRLLLPLGGLQGSAEENLDSLGQQAWAKLKPPSVRFHRVELRVKTADRDMDQAVS